MALGTDLDRQGRDVVKKALARRGPCRPAEPEGWIRRPPSTGPAALRLPPEEHSRAMSGGRRHMR
jgi:hypothetical protein